MSSNRRYTEFQLFVLAFLTTAEQKQEESGEAFGSPYTAKLPLSHRYITTQAATWAPSYNNQPWRFIYAKRNTLHWDKLFNLLAEPNKVWTKDAALLVVVVSRKNFEYNENSITHKYDAGAAWENLALEATSRGLVTHGMQGFDYEKARIDLEIPDTFDVMAMIAIGKKRPKDNLPLNLLVCYSSAPRCALNYILYPYF